MCRRLDAVENRPLLLLARVGTQAWSLGMRCATQKCLSQCLHVISIRSLVLHLLIEHLCAVFRFAALTNRLHPLAMCLSTASFTSAAADVSTILPHSGHSGTNLLPSSALSQAWESTLRCSRQNVLEHLLQVKGRKSCCLQCGSAHLLPTFANSIVLCAFPSLLLLLLLLLWWWWWLIAVFFFFGLLDCSCDRSQSAFPEGSFTDDAAWYLLDFPRKIRKNTHLLSKRW
jgi:hypothetical protein